MKKNIIWLLLTIALTVGAAPSVTLRAHNNLVGAKRIPHKTLSPEQVALKNSVAFMLCDWVAYSETLPVKEAKKWKNRKVSPGQIETRKHSLKINHKYTVISSKKAKNQCIVVIEEKVQTSIHRYKLTLRKTAAGWIVIKFDVIKK